MNTIPLKGHSGCAISVQSVDGEVFVRKISKNLDYNHRLSIQCAKQSEFRGSALRAPVVYREGTNDEGLFYFDMEYVSGITMAKSIGRLTNDDLVKMFSCLLEPSLCGEVVENDAILKKCEEISRHQLFEKKYEYFVDLVRECAPKKIQQSYCHGDLTLENIVVSGSDLYLIDFLDSFVNSWLVDYGKILQDSEALWSYRHDNYISPDILLKLDFITSIVYEAAKRQGISSTQLRSIVILNLLRIIPYSNDTFTRDFIFEQLKKISKMMR